MQTVLGPRLIGMYVEGSLASGTFDEASDIDFVAVTDHDISGDLFVALQTMHDQIAAIDSPWATELEGSYIGQHALRRYDPAHAVHPNIERGPGERLKPVHHHADWIVHRAIMRERGMALFGPPPHTLIDPITPRDLRQAMLDILQSWVVPMLHNPAPPQERGYQSYLVLTLCRMLYTLDQGAVASKPVAARWAQQTLPRRWVPLIERAWAGRSNPQGAATAEDVQETHAFMRYVLEGSRQWSRSI